MAGEVQEAGRRFSVPIRRMSVYESPSRFYLVGADATDSRYSVLKVDRIDARNLSLCDGGAQYSKSEINELLAMLNDSSPALASISGKASDKKSGNRNTGGLTERVHNAVGLLGFVRFLEGHYMILVTKSSPVAQLGFHTIHKVEDIAMVYVPADDLSSSNVDEVRYLRLFQSVDLTTNFYFSFTYDLSRTLQSNVIDPGAHCRSEFIWNTYLMEPLKEHGETCHRWAMPVVHGFVGRSVVSTPATCALSLLLIARRSRLFAGTRFLRRGANLNGWVANDVETEQIAWDKSSPNAFDRTRMTAFVQRRGSVPLAWSQNTFNRAMGKPPPIVLDLADPFAQSAAGHFKHLCEQYSSPIVVVNLVKRREKRVHESMLHDQLKKAISYLNQFLPPEESLLYLSFDVARCNKVGNVLPKLEEIGYNVVPKVGWFQSFPTLYCQQMRRTPLLQDYLPRCARSDTTMLVQHGVARTNCVDCLDRTNVAQFVVGKVALACQLYAMGLLAEPILPLHTTVCDVLEALYEEHGDTLALQYAGSQLVHSIKTYKKTAVFQERSRDVIQTLSRYYSNTFNDHDKQMAINLFLGVYRVDRHRQMNALPHLWDLFTDTYLHNPCSRPQIDYCHWFSDGDAAILPALTRGTSEDEDTPTDFDIHYRTFELTSFDSLLQALNQTKPTYADSLITESGSQPILRLWKQKNDTTGQAADSKADKKKKDGGGDDRQSSAPSVTGSAGDAEWSSDDEEDVAGEQSDVDVVYDAWLPPDDHMNASARLTMRREDVYDQSKGLCRGLVSTRQAYGFELHAPSPADQAKYAAYCQLGGVQPTADDLEWMRTRSRLIKDDRMSLNKLETMSLFTNDSVFAVAVPVVSEAAMRKYRESVAVATFGPKMPSAADQLLYNQYVSSRLRM